DRHPKVTDREDCLEFPDPFVSEKFLCPLQSIYDCQYQHHFATQFFHSISRLERGRTFGKHVVNDDNAGPGFQVSFDELSCTVRLYFVANPKSFHAFPMRMVTDDSCRSKRHGA